MSNNQITCKVNGSKGVLWIGAVDLLVTPLCQSQQQMQSPQEKTHHIMQVYEHEHTAIFLGD